MDFILPRVIMLVDQIIILSQGIRIHRIDSYFKSAILKIE